MAGVKSSPAVAVVMCGGSGTRFWPMSRKTLPKQYLSLFGDRSLLQDTLDRVRPVVGENNLFICSAENQREIAQRQAGKGVGIFLEPQAKNTAPCLMWSVLGLLDLGRAETEVMVALPADHFVRDAEKFQKALSAAVALAAREGVLVTLGITPSSPHTGYGYIEGREKWGEGDFLKVSRFVEKPDLPRAQEFFRQKTYFWNAGIFVGTLKAFRGAFEKHTPQSWNALRTTSGAERARAYAGVKAEPIDTAVMEKEARLAVLPVGDVGWSDVGSWNALAELLGGNNPSGNHSLGGEIHAVDSQSCFVAAQKKVALLGVENLIVVDTPDFLLVADRDHDQRVREIATKLDN